MSQDLPFRSGWECPSPIIQFKFQCVMSSVPHNIKLVYLELQQGSCSRVFLYQILQQKDQHTRGVKKVGPRMGLSFCQITFISVCVGFTRARRGTVAVGLGTFIKTAWWKKPQSHEGLGTKMPRRSHKVLPQHKQRQKMDISSHQEYREKGSVPGEEMTEQSSWENTSVSVTYYFKLLRALMNIGPCERTNSMDDLTTQL